MKKNKAFTIVELIIVIAVIGVLAAILIPTFTRIINKANRSKDVQFSADINKALILSRTGAAGNGLLDSFLAEAVNLGFNNFDTVVENTRLVWDMGNDTVLYVDNDGNVLNKDSEFDTDEHLWYDLSQQNSVIEQTVTGESVDFDDLFN